MFTPSLNQVRVPLPGALPHVLMAVLVQFLSANAATAETSAASSGAPEPEVGELQHWRIEPVQVPQAKPPANPSGALSVDEILKQRASGDISPADADYPLVPGCVPVRGETGRLPVVPDRSHHYASRSICLPAQWIDSFFAPEGADFHAARTQLRIIPTSLWQRDTDRADNLRINARVTLPHTSERLSLILRSDDRNDDRLIERTEADEMDGEEAEGVFRGALRWVAYQTRRLTTSLDAGARGRAPFVRSRFRWRTGLPASAWLRFNQDFYWRGDEDRRGSALELQLERPLGHDMALRLTSGAESNTRLRNDNVRWQWSQGSSWFWRMRKRAALQAGFRVRGRSEPNWRADSYRASIRYRRSIWRPWFYYEVEPFTLWRRENNFRRSPGAVLRVEMKFGTYP